MRKRFNADRTLIHLPAKAESGNTINNNRYADNESNALLVVYEKENFDVRGTAKKPNREFELISFFNYIQKNQGAKNCLMMRKKKSG